MLVEIVIMKVAHLVVDYHSACYKCFSYDGVFSSLAVGSSCSMFRLHDVLFGLTTTSLSYVWMWY
jgi:hypothetical protein